ncbi:hypothetical protein FQR65_LT00278 [Abscondita terminalis]|nr:hypothetical protein FQR65_LT00278 [Abscondita terminalis]
MIETEIEKLPFKFIEIPLNKFRDELIPHHQAKFKTYKNSIEKLISSCNYVELQKELKQDYPVLRQLKNLIYELDTLRDQVIESDLNQFNNRVAVLKKEISALIQNYLDLRVHAADAFKNYSDDKFENPGDKITSQNCQLMLEADLEEFEIYDKQRQLQRLTSINKDIEDVHQIFENLQEMTVLQTESANIIESNVEHATFNIKKGFKHLIQASKLKATSFPIAGACLGTVIGGPLGSVAGLKIGAVAAIGFGIVGYASGRFVKKKKIQMDIENNEIEMINQVDEIVETKKLN